MLGAPLARCLDHRRGRRSLLVKPRHRVLSRLTPSRQFKPGTSGPIMAQTRSWPISAATCDPSREYPQSAGIQANLGRPALSVVMRGAASRTGDLGLLTSLAGATVTSD